MYITKADYPDIEILKSWFPDFESGYNWCGPGLRFPFTEESFLEDIHWEKMPSYSLRDDKNQIIGFGQYYEKYNRCHLARLAISPAHRSMGLGQNFILKLLGIGMDDLGTEQCSLFVVNSNKNAVKCYESLGFKKAKYPPNHKIYNNIDFMVRKNA